MKKFLVILIFLIPVIVIIAIQSAGAAIQAWAPPVNAEGVEIRDEFNFPVNGGRVIVPRLMPDGSDGYSFVYINVTPSICYSQEIKYIMSQEETYDGKCELVHVKDNKYKIVAKRNGSALMRIYSATNDNAYSMLNVYITSQRVTQMFIYAQDSPDGEISRMEEASQIDWYEGLKLYAYASPAEALGDNFITWESADENIAEVDANGKIYPRGVGRVKITAFVTDKTNKEHFTFIYVNIKEENLLCSHIVDISKSFWEELNQSQHIEYIESNLILNRFDEDGEIIESEASISKKSENQYGCEYSVNGQNLAINYVDADEIIIKSDYINEIYTNNGGYTLIVAYADSSKIQAPKVTYNISDKSVLKIDGEGRIIPLKEGECIISATDVVSGKKTQDLYVEVKSRLYAFQLELTNMDNIKGIKQERVWGLSWFDGKGGLTNKFKLNCSNVYPTASNYDLVWQIDNEEYADIDAEGNITFKPQSVSKEITLTAYAEVHGVRTELERSYTFKMSEQADTVNVYNFEQFVDANSEKYGKRSVALQNGITVERKAEIATNNSIYGNGYMFYFVFPENEKFINDNALAVRSANINQNVKELIFENFTIQCDDDYLGGLYKGTCIFFGDLSIPCTLRYVIARYAYRSLNISLNKSVMTVEGCILGNTGLAAIYFADNYMDDFTKAGTLIIRNCVFKETGCASLVTTPYSINKNITDKNYVPNVKIEGFIDSYNWKKVNQLHGIFNALDDKTLGDIKDAREAISNLLAKYLEKLLKKEEGLVYTDENGEEWVAMNLFALGLNDYIDPRAFDLSGNEEFALMPLALEKGIANIVKKLIDYDVHNPCYLMTYKFDTEKGPIIKPKDACPENEALFTRLKNGN